MNCADWYTDQMDVHRVQSYQDGSLTKQERVKVDGDIPCRIYRSGAHRPRMGSPAADSQSDDKVACGNAVDIQAGDELLIRRGALLGQVRQTVRAFAGDPVYYYEPFGAVLPGLAHQEVGLLQKEYLKGEAEHGAG